MKRIVFIHTVQCMYLTFEKRLHAALRCEVKADNILDTFFASNANELGYFSEQNVARLRLTLQLAEQTGADVIGVICSTLTPHVEKLAPLYKTPIVTIDAGLGEAAIAHGDKIMVLASAQSAVEPTVQRIKNAAQAAGRRVEIASRYDLEAFHAMMNGDMRLHDEKIVAMGRAVNNQDVIVFAQGSMEQNAQAITACTGLPVVTAPALCIAHLKKLLEG